MFTGPEKSSKDSDSDPGPRPEAPLTLTSNPRFLFESASYQAALQEVTFGLSRGESIIVVTGAIGTGKTTLCRIIAEGPGPRTVVAAINSPADNVDDLLRQVLDGFGVLTDDTSQVVRASHYGLLRTLDQFLHSLAPLKLKAIILIDEAQHLRPDVLEQIRLLSDLTADGRTLLQVILVGQPELDALLSRDDLRQVEQRISRRHRLAPLAPAEVSAYVDQRLGAAQTEQSARERPQFTASAMRTIEALSAGVPRVINALSDRALEYAWADENDTIDTTTVVRAARSLNIDVPFAVRVRFVRRRYVQAAVAAALVIGAALLWTARDSALSLLTGRTAAQPAAANATEPAVPRGDTAAPTTARPPAAAAGAQPEANVPPSATAAADRFQIVVSSFRTRARAARVTADIVAIGLPAFVRSTSGWQQVIVGPYVTREEAVGAQTRLAAAQMTGTTIAQSGARPAALPPATESRPPAAAGGGAKIQDASIDTEIQNAPLDEVLRRASALAVQPDVKALLQVRDEILKRQTAANGATELGDIKAALDQLDRYLDEARRRQLEEDARQLRVRP